MTHVDDAADLKALLDHIEAAAVQSQRSTGLPQWYRTLAAEVRAELRARGIWHTAVTQSGRVYG